MSAGVAPRPRVGLVLGSGGPKCFAAIGLWRVLEREGIDVDVIVGCSGGCMPAVGIALGLTADEIETRLARLWTKSVFARRNWGSLARAIFPRLLGAPRRFGLLDDRELRRALARELGDARFEDLARRTFLTATDAETGESVVISHGRVADAMRASMAIPVVLEPWPVDGRLLIDGGVSDPLPVSVAIREQCDVILAMGFASPVEAQSGELAALVSRTTSLIVNNFIRSMYSFYNLAHHAELIALMPEFEGKISLTDPRAFPAIVAQGERCAEEQVPYLRRLLKGAPA